MRNHSLYNTFYLFRPIKNEKYFLKETNKWSHGKKKLCILGNSDLIFKNLIHLLSIFLFIFYTSIVCDSSVTFQSFQLTFARACLATFLEQVTHALMLYQFYSDTFFFVLYFFTSRFPNNFSLFINFLNALENLLIWVYK